MLSSALLWWPPRTTRVLCCRWCIMAVAPGTQHKRRNISLLVQTVHHPLVSLSGNQQRVKVGKQAPIAPLQPRPPSLPPLLLATPSLFLPQLVLLYSKLPLLPLPLKALSLLTIF